MKTTILFIFAFQISLLAQNVKKDFVKLNQNLYASKFEVSNSDYRKFTNWLKQNNKLSDLQTATIDSTNWRNKNTYNEPYVQYYHSHPAYNHYPVVNISYEAAVLYCNWLTQQHNQSKRKKHKKILFKLPTEEEWNLLFSDQYLYGWDSNNERNKKNMAQGNYTQKVEDPNFIHLSDYTDVTAPVKSYWPNKKGFYNVSGNVAEMLDQKGKCRGGSWKDNIEMLQIKSLTANYSQANPTTGFRVFMEIIEE